MNIALHSLVVDNVVVPFGHQSDKIQFLEYQTDMQRCTVTLLNQGQSYCPHKCNGDLDLGLIRVVATIIRHFSVNNGHITE